MENRLSYIITAFLLLAAGPAVAANEEPIWRVENEGPHEVVPLYAGNISPFPLGSAPRIEGALFAFEEVEFDELPKEETREEKKEKELTEEDLLAQERARQAADLLNEIRRIISADQIIMPNINKIVVSAKTLTNKGASILIDNRWFKEGETIKVPIQGARKAFELLNELYEVDPRVADVVSKDLEERISGAGPLQLTISKVKKDVVVLTDEKGNEHTLSFIPSGW